MVKWLDLMQNEIYLDSDGEEQPAKVATVEMKGKWHKFNPFDNVPKEEVKCEITQANKVES